MKTEGILSICKSSAVVLLLVLLAAGSLTADSEIETTFVEWDLPASAGIIPGSVIVDEVGDPPNGIPPGRILYVTENPHFVEFDGTQHHFQGEAAYKYISPSQNEAPLGVALRPNQRDQAYVRTSNYVYVIARSPVAAGQVLTFQDNLGSSSSMVSDANGILWSTGSGVLQGLEISGTFAGVIRYNIGPDIGSSVASNKAGQVYFSNSTELRELNPLNNFVRSWNFFSLGPINEMCVDDGDRVWLRAGPNIARLNPDNLQVFVQTVADGSGSPAHMSCGQNFVTVTFDSGKIATYLPGGTESFRSYLTTTLTPTAFTISGTSETVTVQTGTADPVITPSTATQTGNSVTAQFPSASIASSSAFIPFLTPYRFAYTVGSGGPTGHRFGVWTTGLASHQPGFPEDPNAPDGRITDNGTTIGGPSICDGNQCTLAAGETCRAGIESCDPAQSFCQSAADGAYLGGTETCPLQGDCTSVAGGTHTGGLFGPPCGPGETCQDIALVGATHAPGPCDGPCGIDAERTPPSTETLRVRGPDDPSPADPAFALSPDRTTRYILTEYSDLSNPTQGGYQVASIDQTSQVLWTRTLLGPGFLQPIKMTTSPDGNRIYVLSIALDPVNLSLLNLTVAYGRDGTVHWSRGFYGQQFGSSEGTDIVATSDKVWVAGTDFSDTTFEDAMLLAYIAVDGSVSYTYRYDGQSSSADFYVDAELSPDGSLLCTAGSPGQTT